MDAQTKAMQRIAAQLGTDYMSLVDGIDGIELSDLLILQAALNARAQRIAKELTNN